MRSSDSLEEEDVCERIYQQKSRMYDNDRNVGGHMKRDGGWKMETRQCRLTVGAYIVTIHSVVRQCLRADGLEGNRECGRDRCAHFDVGDRTSSRALLDHLNGRIAFFA